MEAAQQTTTTPQAHPQEPQWDTGYGGGYLGHHESGSYYPSHGYPEPSLWAETSSSIRYPNWYAPLERYANYGVDRAERTVDEIGQLEWRMDDFAHVQTEMQASIDSQTNMMHDLFSHFEITLMLKSWKDLSLGEVPSAQVRVLACLRSFPVFPIILSLVSLVVPLLSSWVLVWIASTS
jgi:hypothetical protein